MKEYFIWIILFLLVFDFLSDVFYWAILFLFYGGPQENHNLKKTNVFWEFNIKKQNIIML